MPSPPFAEEHDVLRDSVRRLVDAELAPLAAVAERDECPPPAAFDRCRDLFGIDDVLAAVVVAEELGRLRSAGLVAALLAQDAAAALGVPIDEPVAVAGRAALTVEGTTVSGRLPLLVAGQVARRCYVWDAGVVVESGPSWTVAAVRAPHGLRGAGLADVDLDDAPVLPLNAAPAARARAAGRAVLLEAAATVAAAWRTWDDARRYAGEREAFGRPIGRFQINRHRLAEGATTLTAARALVHDTAAAAAGDGDGDVDATAARLYAGRVAAAVADTCLQLHGGYGYTTDFDAERAWRDAHALRVGDDARRVRLVALARQGGAS